MKYKIIFITIQNLSELVRELWLMKKPAVTSQENRETILEVNFRNHKCLNGSILLQIIN